MYIFIKCLYYTKKNGVPVYLFIYLFMMSNDPVSSSKYIASNFIMISE